MDIGSVWKLMGRQGNQMNPSVMAQMSQEAAPEDPSIPPFLRAQRAQQPMPPPPRPPSPQIIPVETGGGQHTAQPTTSPTGSVAQELQPQQPTFQFNDKMTEAQRRYFKMSDAFKFQPNAQMLDELKTGQKNYSDLQGMHQAEIDKLKTGLADYQGADQGINTTPLAALLDARYGGNLAKAAESMAPQTAAQKAETTAGMQGKIATAQGEMTKEQSDYLKNKLAQMGYMDERELKAQEAKLNAAAKVAAPSGAQMFAGQKMDLQNQRLDLQKQKMGIGLDKEARTTVNNDSMLKQFGPRLEGAAKIGELINAAKSGKVVSNQALLGQVNAEIARLETGSQSPGLGASEKTELQDRKAQLQSYVDSFTGAPSDAVRPEVLDTGGKLVTELSGSYMKGIDSRMAGLRAGMTPAQQKILDEKHNSLKSTYAPRFGGWHGLNEVKGGLPKVGDVEDGHVYLGGDPAAQESWRPQ